MKKIIILLFLLLASSIYYLAPVHADEIDDLTVQIKELSHKRELSVNATKPLEGQLGALQRQLAQIQASLDALAANIQTKQKDLDVREEKLALQQAILETRVRAYYIRSYSTSPLLVILSSTNPGELFRELSYRQTATREDKRVIGSITHEVEDLLTQKDKLEKDKIRTASLQAQVDKNATFLGGEIKKAKAYQADLSSKIIQLTAKQQEILAQRLGSLNIPRSAATSVPACVDDRSIDPGFGNAMAFFTYGVPNRVGLNQYGAWGRAKLGQSAEQILQEYYPGLTLKKDYDSGATINVNGYGSFNVEDYVKRIYEMPDSWADNGSAALKAQAVAARSYGLAHRGGICATDYCQVFKPDPKGGNWEGAVNATRGWVLVDGGGNPVSTQYSSTHGGYILNLNKFDGLAGNPTSFTDLKARAYDRDSPWFYCDWGSRTQYNKTAWLRQEEVADIVNTLLLVQADSGTAEHLYQTDKSYPDNWNEAQVRQELTKRSITPYSNVSSISVSVDFNSGATTSVNVSGDGGSRSFNGGDFKNRFNLRAPANIQIVGPLFNMEKR